MNDTEPTGECLFSNPGPENAKVLMEAMALRLIEQTEQTWVEDYLEKAVDWTDEEGSAWLRSRPKHVQDMLIRFPLFSLVRAVDTQSLHVPAEGTVGIVVSITEKGNGEVLPRVVQSPEGRVAAACDPNWLELVAWPPGGSPDDLRQVINGD